MPLPQPAAQDNTLSELLELINRQLTEKGLKVEKASAAVIDATIIQTAGSKQRQAIEVDEEGQVSGQTTPSKDKDARWTKKNGLYRLGYKQHTRTDAEGYIEKLHITTPANTHECNHLLPLLEGITQDKRFDSRCKDLKKESIGYLNRHPDWVADYLKAEYAKLDAEDKSILHRYVKPGAEIVSGSLGVVLSGVAGGGSCAETFGLGCAAALVGITSSYDHVITGTKNFGKKASEQRPTITVQTLKQLGLSEQAAEYVQFSIDLFSVGKSGAGMPKAKPVSDAKPRWEVDRKLNKLTTREQVEKNVQEIRNGNKNSNFNQHAQIEKEIKKLSRGPSGLIGKEFEDWLVKFHGGNGSFKMGGREFDGAITINRWYEAKSGNFWRDHASTPQKFERFKSDMGDRLKIATKNGATYELHSNTPIPKHVKEFLNKKGIKYFEY